METTGTGTVFAVVIRDSGVVVAAKLASPGFPL